MRLFSLNWTGNACGPNNLTLRLGLYTAQLGFRPRCWYGGRARGWLGLGLWVGPCPLVLFVW